MIIDLYDEISMKSAERYLKQCGQITGLLTGVFDLTHVYHIRTFRRALQSCDLLIVGVDADTLVRQIKGPERPIFNELHRLELVDSCKYVAMTFLMGDVKDAYQLLARFGINFFFKNDAFRGREQELKDEYFLPNTEAEIVILPDVEELTSTSDFINRIQGKRVSSIEHAVNQALHDIKPKNSTLGQIHEDELLMRDLMDTLTIPDNSWTWAQRIHEFRDKFYKLLCIYNHGSLDMPANGLPRDLYEVFQKTQIMVEKLFNVQH